jgi:hypothetical protein
LTKSARKDTPRPPRAPHAIPASPAAWLDLRAPYLGPIVVALLARAWQSSLIPFAAEDAYITFRFAEHWAHGLGPVFNEGERVMGFSSPLWTALLALGSLVTGEAFPVARILGIALDLATLLLASRLLEKEHGRVPAWIFAVFFAIYPIFAANSVLGMETSLFVFLLVATAWAIGAQHRSAGAALGLLALVRPEGVAAAAIAGIAARPRDRLVGLAIFGLGSIGLALYFGSPIPQSVLAKAATYGLGGPLAGLQWIEGILPLFIRGKWPVTAEAVNLLPLALVGTPAAIAGARVLWSRRGRPGTSWIVGVVGSAVLAVYFVFGVPFFFWYAVVPTAGWAWLAAIGLPEISRSRLLYAALAIYVLSNTILLRNLYAGRVQEEALAFRTAGNVLRQVSGGHGTVFLEPIGHVGEMTGLRVIDEVGLVSPRVARRRVQGNGWYADVVQAERPDFLVVRRGFFERNQSFAGVSAPFRGDGDRAAVLAAYEEVPQPAVAPMVVYRRRP